MAVPSRQDVELDVLEQLVEHAAVGGERRLGEGGAGEDHQPDAVAGAPGDEVAEHPLGHRQAVVGLEVLAPHAPGDVEGQLDVDPFGQALLPGVAELRPGEGDGEQRQGAEAGVEGEVEPPAAAGAGRHPAVGEGAQAWPPVVPHGEQRQGRQQQQPGRGGEVGERGHAAASAGDSPAAPVAGAGCRWRSISVATASAASARPASISGATSRRANFTRSQARRISTARLATPDGKRAAGEGAQDLAGAALRRREAQRAAEVAAEGAAEQGVADRGRRRPANLGDPGRQLGEGVDGGPAGGGAGGGARRAVAVESEGEHGQAQGAEDRRRPPEPGAQRQRPGRRWRFGFEGGASRGRVAAGVGRRQHRVEGQREAGRSRRLDRADRRRGGPPPAAAGPPRRGRRRRAPGAGGRWSRRRLRRFARRRRRRSPRRRPRRPSRPSARPGSGARR